MDRPAAYRPVRALHRGLAVLQELNRLGIARPADLAQATGIDRTTIYRLLATLEAAGLVRQGASDDRYVLTQHVRTLSEGFIARDRVAQIAATHLGAMFPRVLWPTDFATFDRGAMVIRETTHRFSPYSVHRAMVGQPRPLLTSALGRAALAGATEQQRMTMIDVVRGTLPPAADRDRQLDDQVAHIRGDFEKRGYGWSTGGSGGTISAIAVPVQTGEEAAAINLVFFTSAMAIDVAAARFADALRVCARQIERELLPEETIDSAT